jgi:hypothetical protein
VEATEIQSSGQVLGDRLDDNITTGNEVERNEDACATAPGDLTLDAVLRAEGGGQLVIQLGEQRAQLLVMGRANSRGLSGLQPCPEVGPAIDRGGGTG